MTFPVHNRLFVTTDLPLASPGHLPESVLDEREGGREKGEEG